MLPLSMELTIFLSQLVSTLFMVGLIWIVQVVHYPLFNGVGESNFVEYQRRHQRNITMVVGPVMLIELFSALLMVYYPLEGVPMRLIFLSLGSVLLIWISTAMVQIPCHARLERGFDRQAYRRLVGTNWLRTIVWTLRGGLVVWMLILLLTNPTGS